MQSRLEAKLEKPVYDFKSDPSGFVLSRLAEIEQFQKDLLDRFEEFEERVFSEHCPRVIEDTIVSNLKREMNACRRECQRDIYFDEDIVGNEKAILERVSHCKRELKLLSTKSVAQI